MVGDPFAEGVHLGPLASAAQRDRVQGYIQKGIDEGADAGRRWSRRARGPRHRLLRPPTVFSDVTPDMTIAQEEIFGPVLSIIPYDDDDDAVEHRQRRRSTAWPVACGRPTPSGPRASPGACAPARSRSTAARSTRTRRSAATSSRASAASTARHGLEEFLEVKSLQL